MTADSYRINFPYFIGRGAGTAPRSPRKWKLWLKWRLLFS